MGFSVTAASVIFFIAALTAGSAALDAYFESKQTQTVAQDTWRAGLEQQAATNLTLFVNVCDSSCNPATVPNIDIWVENTGSSVVDALNLTFVIDGVAYTSASFADYDIIDPLGVGATHLILPGETMEIDFDNIPITANYDDDNDATDDDDLPVQAMTLDGVVGRR